MLIVTGAKGFVGRYVCEELNKRNILYEGIDLPDNIVHMGDVNHLWDTYPIDSIIHCAAIAHTPDTIQSPYRTFDVNIKGTVNLLEMIRYHRVKRFVYLSSVSTYGDFGNWMITEDFPLRPKGIYGATKACADFLCQAYCRTYGIPVVIIRTSAVYGQGDKHPRLVKNFVENAINNKPLIVKGNGLLRRDFTYVKDLVQGIMLCLEKEEAIGQAFNITSGRTHTIKDLIEMIRKLIPIEVKYEKGRKIDLQRGEIDISKARNVLGYNPQYTLEQGLKEMISGLRNI